MSHAAVTALQAAVLSHKHHLIIHASVGPIQLVYASTSRYSTSSDVIEVEGEDLATPGYLRDDRARTYVGD